MSVSQATQNGMYAKHADETIYVKTIISAKETAARLRSDPSTTKVQIRQWNNGTRNKPRFEYKVLIWRK